MSQEGEQGELIRTRSVARNVAHADEVVLTTTPTTRTLFRPVLTDKGVRGWIVRQKIGEGGLWLDVNEINFRRAAPDFAVAIELSSSDVSTLYEEFGRLYEVQGLGVRAGQHTYAVGPADEMVRVTDARIADDVRRMVEQGHSAHIWQELVQADPDLANRLAAGQLQSSRQVAIAEFAVGLVDHPDDESYWQDLFWQHPWMLQCASAATVYVLSGDTYIGGKLPIGRSGRGGVATDFVTADASTKSFGVIEIKTPHASLVGPVYRGTADEEIDFDNVVYSMHGDLTGAVVQTRNQVAVAVESFRETLSRHPEGRELNRLHPKGILIAGTLEALNERERASFNQFRHGQHDLTILTFDELLRRLAITYEVELTDKGAVGGRAAWSETAEEAGPPSDPNETGGAIPAW